jgi:small multidrug resistance pump
MSRYHQIALSRGEAWWVLALTIACEVVATLATKASDGFTRPVPVAVALLGFGLTTLFLAKVLEVIPTSIAYTIWTGSGSALVVVFGVVIFGDALTVRGATGIVLVVAGIIILNLPARASEPEGPGPLLH